MQTIIFIWSIDLILWMIYLSIQKTTTTTLHPNTLHGLYLFVAYNRYK